MSWMLLATLFVGTPENTLVRYNALIGSGEPAIAAARDSVLLAWSEIDPNGVSRISVAPLDALGRIAGPVTPLPRTREDGTKYAVAPVVASDGNGFLIAWQEGRAWDNAPRVIVMRLDASLKPDITTMRELTPMSNVPFRGIQLAWNGKSYDLVAYMTRWRFDAEGRELARVPWFKADAIASARNGTSATTWFDTLQQSGFVPCGFSVCSFTTFRYFVTTTVTREGVASIQTLERPWYSGNPPALAATSRDHMLAWYGNSRIETQRLDLSGTPAGSASFLATYPLATRATPPQIASDGERYLVVWTWDDGTGHYAVETAFDEDGKISPFTIPTSIRPSSTPRVAAIGYGRFLVVYTYNGVIYSRLIETGSPKRRAR